MQLTPATEFDGEIGRYKYHFDSNIYKNRVFDSRGVADETVEIQFGPNIKDWPACLLSGRTVSGLHRKDRGTEPCILMGCIRKCLPDGDPVWTQYQGLAGYGGAAGESGAACGIRDS